MKKGVLISCAIYMYDCVCVCVGGGGGGEGGSGLIPRPFFLQVSFPSHYQMGWVQG